MAVLATTTDVEHSLGRSLDSAEEIARAEDLLVKASAMVEEQTGYRFAPGEYTIGRRVHAGQVTVPAAKTATITEIRDIDQRDGVATVLTGWTHRGRKIYGINGIRRETQFFAQRHRRFVEIDFTVTDPVPGDVVALVAGCVANTLAGPPVGASQEHAGPFHISYVNSNGKVWLSASDKQILAKYTVAKPALSLL